MDFVTVDKEFVSVFREPDFRVFFTRILLSWFYIELMTMI